MTPVETVQKVYQCFQKRDFDGLLALWEEPAHLQAATGLSAEDIPWAGKHEGKAAVAEFFSMYIAENEIKRFEPQEWITEGNTVVVRGAYEMTCKRNGKPITSEWIHLYRLMDGKVVSLQVFSDTAALLAAYKA